MAITSTEAAAAIPKIYLQQFWDELWPQMIFSRFGQKDFSASTGSVGDKVFFNGLGDVTVQDMAEGGTVVADSPSNTSVFVELTNHFVCAWDIEDRVSALAIKGSLDYIKKAGRKTGQRVEQLIISELNTGIPNAVGVAGTPLDYDLLLDAGEVLDDNNVDVENRYLVVRGPEKKQILKTKELTSGEYTEKGAIRKARMGEILGMDALLSNLLPTAGGNTGFAFDPTAFVTMMRTLPLPEGVARAEYFTDPATGMTLRYHKAYDSKKLKMQHVIDVLVGVSVVDPNQAVRILT